MASGAVAGGSRVLRSCAAALMLAAWPMAPALAQAPGPEVCQGCHAGYVETFNASLHGKKGHPKSPASAGGCIACHGDFVHALLASATTAEDAVQCTHCHRGVGHGERAALGR